MIERKEIIQKAKEMGLEVTSKWSTNRLEKAIKSKETEAKPLEYKKVEKEISLEKNQNEEKEISLENSECPANACQDLQEQWGKTVNCYNADSRYCLTCKKDFVETMELCKKLTEQYQSRKKEQATKRKIIGRTKVGFGHVEGTQAAAIDLCLQQGMTKEQIIANLNENNLNSNNLNNKVLWSRVQRHFDDLKKMHDICISNKEGKYTGTPNIA